MVSGALWPVLLVWLLLLSRFWPVPKLGVTGVLSGRDAWFGRSAPWFADLTRDSFIIAIHQVDIGHERRVRFAGFRVA